MNVSEKTYTNDGNPAVLALVPAHATRILDVGCGTGDNARQLAARGAIVDGVTLSNDEQQIAQQVCRRVYVHDLEHGLPDLEGEQYDAIICSHVLEHICWPRPLLRDLKGALAADGALIVALPNFLWWKNRLRIARGRFEYEPSGIMDATHFRWYTYASGRELLEDNGFEVVASQAEGSFPFGPSKRVIPRSLQQYANRAVSAAWPGLFGYQMLYKAQQRVIASSLL